jgi:hypothetical protein
MKLRTIDIIILLVLGLLCVARATWGIFKDINANLSTAQSVTGQVVYADVIQIEKTTFKSRKYKTVFALKLENSNQNFAVDRGVSICNYLNTKIKKATLLSCFTDIALTNTTHLFFKLKRGKKF